MAIKFLFFAILAVAFSFVHGSNNTVKNLQVLLKFDYLVFKMFHSDYTFYVSGNFWLFDRPLCNCPRCGKAAGLLQTNTMDRTRYLHFHGNTFRRRHWRRTQVRSTKTKGTSQWWKGCKMEYDSRNFELYQRFFRMHLMPATWTIFLTGGSMSVLSLEWELQGLTIQCLHNGQQNTRKEQMLFQQDRPLVQRIAFTSQFSLQR